MRHFNFTIEPKKVFLAVLYFRRFQISTAKPRNFYAKKISCLKVKCHAIIKFKLSLEPTYSNRRKYPTKFAVEIKIKIPATK